MNQTGYKLFPVTLRTQQDVFGTFTHFSDETLEPAERLHVSNLLAHNPTRYLFGLALRPEMQSNNDRAGAYRAGVFIGGVLMRSVLRQHQIDVSGYRMPGILAQAETTQRLERYKTLAKTSRFVLGQFFEDSEDMKDVVRGTVERRRELNGVGPMDERHADEEVGMVVVGLGDSLALYAALHNEPFEAVEPLELLDAWLFAQHLPYDARN